MKNDKVIEKIKKLLALAKSDNAHEAASALAKAQKLMQANQVTSTDIDLSDCQKTESLLDCQRPNRYEIGLISTISDAFGVEPVIGYTVKNHKLIAKVSFLGISAQPELAQYCFDVLYRQLKKARSQHVKSQSNRCKPSTKTKRGDMFAEGWVFSIRQKITKFALSDEQKSLIEQFKAATFDDLTTGQGRDRNKKQARRSQDVTAGMAAAKDVRLDRPVNGNETLKLE